MVVFYLNYHYNKVKMYSLNQSGKSKESGQTSNRPAKILKPKNKQMSLQSLKDICKDEKNLTLKQKIACISFKGQQSKNKRDKLKKHAMNHTTQHMESMIKMMASGKSFNKAHEDTLKNYK